MSSLILSQRSSGGLVYASPQFIGNTVEILSLSDDESGLYRQLQIQHSITMSIGDLVTAPFPIVVYDDTTLSDVPPGESYIIIQPVVGEIYGVYLTVGDGGSADAFAFTSQNSVPLNSLRTSNYIIVNGLLSTAIINISGGTYSKNEGAYTEFSGEVTNGDIIRVRHTSSGNLNTPVVTTLTIGTTVGTFTSTTRAAVTTVVTPTVNITVLVGSTDLGTTAVVGEPPITFTKGGVNSSLVYVDPVTGERSFLDPAVVGNYSFTVTASGPGGSAIQTVSVNVVTQLDDEDSKEVQLPAAVVPKAVLPKAKIPRG